MTTVPITSAAILPPFVTDISHVSLVKWKRQRREYVDAITARCAITGEDTSRALVSVKNSIDSHLLEMLCKFDWSTTVEAVSEQQIVAEIDKIVNNIKNGDIDEVDVRSQVKDEPPRG
ncbi:hypothetical protein PHMEG_00039005 [Phytophthora megakarya]|uniref:Uncharacterized protein n=1 Tax=Phytophthora megakarya TaxID=4795 RepID=A0A225UGP4_9STRA|nr:hypothetical protein PHMEG_00039005 [Phytophthora megakarya]